MPTPIEQITLINQNIPVASIPQVNFLNRIELQNAAAANATVNKEEEIEEPEDLETNRSLLIDPDRDHSREVSEISVKEKEEETFKAIRKKPRKKEQEEEEKPQTSPFHILDIKV